MKNWTEEAAAPGLAGVLLRAWKRRRMQRQDRVVKVLETVALGGRARLHVVVCGEERFLVGSGAESVQCIVPVGAGSQAIEMVSE